MASVPARSIGTYLVSVHKHCQLPFSQVEHVQILPYLPQVKPKVSINTALFSGLLLVRTDSVIPQ